MVIGEMAQEVDLVVIGGGPGGYTAAIRAAELGVNTIMVNDMPAPGGACLHMGCIPSKALLHAAEVIEAARESSAFGLHFAEPKVNLDELRSWKSGIINKLSDGLRGMCNGAGVETIAGRAVFVDSRNVRVEASNSAASTMIKFKHAILATGSRPLQIPGIKVGNPHVLDSTSALELKDIPTKLLIVGGGYIGLEMGSVYAALGSEVTVVEMMDSLLPGVDQDLVKPLAAKLQQLFRNIYLNCRVVSIEEEKNGVSVSLDGNNVPKKLSFDRVLVAIGRRPNSDKLGLESTKVEIDPHGFVIIDRQCRTTERRIFAVGDVSGLPLLAHRAIRQGMVASEVISGKESSFDNRAIPAVIFTEPEIAWCGLTENEARAQQHMIEVARYRWLASGRAQTLNSAVGHTKIIFDPQTSRVLGVGMAGSRAGDLISEAVLAIEMGATLEDIALTIHPHPTLSETLADVALAGLKRQDRRSNASSR